MEFLAEISLLLLSLALLAFVLIDYLRGKSDLVSIRNVAIGGFVLFQTLSGALWLIDDNYRQEFFLRDPGRTGMTFAIASAIFMIIAIVVYRWGPVAKQAARFVPKPGIVPSDTTMWLTAAVLTLSAGVFRFAVFIPYISVLTSILGTAVAGTAAGLIGWMLGRNLKNPVTWAIAGTLLLLNLGIVLTGEYGRRTIITLGLGVGFGLYYSRLRYESPKRTVALLLIATIPLVMFLGAFTSVRGGSARRGNAIDLGRAILTGGSIKDGLKDVDGQGTGGVSMWLMEYFGDDGVREPQTLRAFQYFILFPAPRAMFPFKPEPLSLDIARYANIQGVKQGGMTIGPGIIGHSFSDGGWIVLVFYASLGGLIVRFGDEIIQRSPHAPFVVLPAGSMLGEIMGVPRGESSAMLFLFVFGTASCYVYVACIGKALEYFGYAQKGDADVAGMGPAGWEIEGDHHDDDPNDDHHEHDPYAEYADYGNEHDYGEEGAA